MTGGGLGAHWKGTTLWGYAPMAEDLTLDRHDTSRIYMSSGYGEAAGIMMCLLTFLPIWAAEYSDRQPSTRELRELINTTGVIEAFIVSAHEDGLNADTIGAVTYPR